MNKIFWIFFGNKGDLGGGGAENEQKKKTRVSKDSLVMKVKSFIFSFIFT